MESGTIWRETVEKHHAALAAELTAQLESEITRSRDSASRQTTDSLNQLLRRLRQAPAEAQTLQLVIEASAPWSERLVVVVVEGSHFRIAGNRGVEILDTGLAQESSPALNACAESKDPVMVLTSPAEVGPVLAETLGNDSKAWLFPVVVRSRTAVILLAAGEVSPITMELLSEAVGMRLESQRTPMMSFGEPGAKIEPQTWADLSTNDQSRHLLAQRVARVRVAEMRLADPGRLEKAVFVGNVYDAFRGEIDRAREEFLRLHLTQSPTMVDYLHLEILRSLAHDDERLLGADYPGPMA